MIDVSQEPLDELETRLGELEETGRLMRDALVQKKPKAVWALAERQEKIMNAIEKTRIRIAAPPSPAPPPPPERQNRIRALAQKNRMLQRVNAALTRAVLEAIDKTFETLNGGLDRATLTYGPSGAMARPSAPIFVHQTG